MEVLGTSEVRVAVRIVPKTGSRSYSAAVTYSGERPGHRYQLSVPDVLVTLEGTVNALSTMDPATLLGRIDVAALGPGVHQVPVDVAPPQGTAVVSVSPAQVGVTVLAPTPPPSPTPAPTPSVPPVLPSVPASSPPPLGG
jgi:YbbR domain-containing protein